MSKIIDRTGKGSALTAAEYDSALDILHGINEPQTGTTHTIDVNDQGKTIEYSNASAIAVTLPAISTVSESNIDTSDFKITLKNIGAGTVTATRSSTDTFDDGGTSVALLQGEWVTIQTDSTLGKWNIINSGGRNLLGITASATELNYNDITTLGTVQASKTVTADANAGFKFDTSAAAREILFDNGTYRSNISGSSTEGVGIYDYDSASPGTVFRWLPSTTTFTIYKDTVITTLGVTDLSVDTVTAKTTNGDLALSSNGTGKITFDGVIPCGDYVKLSYTVASGNTGGTTTGGSWQTQPINTEDYDASSICTAPSANQFTLSAGTYRFRATATAYQPNTHRIRLYNVDDTAVVETGQNNYSASTDATNSKAEVVGEFTIATAKVMRLEYRVGNGVATVGLGQATSWGDENYAVAEFWRIST